MDVHELKTETQAVALGIASSIEASRQFNRILGELFAPPKPPTVTTEDGVICQLYDTIWRQSDDDRIFSDDVVAMQWLSETISISDLNGDEGGLESLTVADYLKELES